MFNLKSLADLFSSLSFHANPVIPECVIRSLLFAPPFRGLILLKSHPNVPLVFLYEIRIGVYPCNRAYYE